MWKTGGIRREHFMVQKEDRVSKTNNYLFGKVIVDLQMAYFY